MNDNETKPIPQPEDTMVPTIESIDQRSRDSDISAALKNLAMGTTGEKPINLVVADKDREIAKLREELGVSNAALGQAQRDKWDLEAAVRALARMVR